MKSIWTGFSRSTTVSPESVTCMEIEESQQANLLDRGELEDQKNRLAGRQGFEPRLSGPEPPVLPLDDLPTAKVILKNRLIRFKNKPNPLINVQLSGKIAGLATYSCGNHL